MRPAITFLNIQLSNSRVNKSTILFCKQKQLLAYCYCKDDTRIAPLLRNSRNSTHIRNPQIFQGKSLLPHVWRVNKSTILFCKQKRLLAYCYCKDDTRIAPLLRNSRNSTHIRNPQIFQGKSLLPHVWRVNKSTILFCKQKRLLTY